jgi:CHAT domain-containing protein/tetratricopeptide (TPR) repeat protein
MEQFIHAFYYWRAILRAFFYSLLRSILIGLILAQLAGTQAVGKTEDLIALNNQAIQLYNQGNYAEAFQHAERALSLAEKALGPEHPDTLTSINNLAFFYQARGRSGEAEPLLLRALRGYEKVLGPEHPDTLACINNLASLYQSQGRYGDAEPLYKRALAGNEKAFGPEHPATLRSVNNIASLYQAQGRYGEAEPLYKRALPGNEKALGPEHPDTLKSVNNLGFLYEAQGRYAEAETLYTHALAGREKALGPEHPDTLRSVNNLGLLYDTQGRYGEAEPLYRRALTGRERALGPEHLETLQTVSNLALLFEAQGRFGDAEPLLKRALAGIEKALGREHPDTFTSVNNLAFFYGELDRYAEAEPLYKRALAGYEKVLGPEHPNTLASVDNLGFFYRLQGRYRKAEPHFRRALAGFEKVLGPEHPNTLASVNNLAFLYQAQGRYGKAKTLYRRALAGNEKALGREHPHSLRSVNNFASLFFEQGDWRTAVQFWRQSTAAIADRVQRGALDAELVGKKKSVTEQFDGQFRGLVKAVYRLAPEGRAEEAAETFQTAQWVLSSEAAQALTQMASRGAGGDSTLSALVRERQDLVDEWQRLEKLQTAALGQEQVRRNAPAEAGNRDRMAAIDARIAGIDAALRDKFPDYAKLASPAPLPVEEAQTLLGADEALVLFLDTPEAKPAPEETFIWVVTKTDMRWVRSDLGTAALTREVQALRCGLDATLWRDPADWLDKTEEQKRRKAEQAERLKRCVALISRGYAAADAEARKPLPFDHARAHRLYKRLFGAVEEMIKGKHLLLVPSGPLTQLPFQALVTAPPASGDHRSAAWLARGHAVTVLPAVSSLKALRATGRPSAATEPMIGFGNPLLDGTGLNDANYAKLAREKQSCPKAEPEQVAALAGPRGGIGPVQTRGGLANVSLLRAQAPLPETADELCAVARDIGGDADAIHLGARATERGIKAMGARGELARYRVVHFATHGLMAGQLSMDSQPGLILTPPAQATEEDDGYLTASEIASLKLDADWVILSACNTAAGESKSAEALSGLARAFFYAQARALLVSHWEVDTDATVKLITSAIREIGSGKTAGRAEALRRAMLALIDKGAHPAYWAPFIVVGEGSR